MENMKEIRRSLRCSICKADDTYSLRLSQQCNAGNRDENEESTENKDLLGLHEFMGLKDVCCTAYHIGCAAFRKEKYGQGTQYVSDKVIKHIHFFPAPTETEGEEQGLNEDENNTFGLYCKKHACQIHQVTTCKKADYYSLFPEKLGVKRKKIKEFQR